MNEMPDLINGKVLLTIEEAARYLSIGRSHAYAYVMTGQLRSVKLGRSRRIPVFAIRDFVESLRAEVHDEP